MGTCCQLHYSELQINPDDAIYFPSDIVTWGNTSASVSPFHLDASFLACLLLYCIAWQEISIQRAGMYQSSDSKKHMSQTVPIQYAGAKHKCLLWLNIDAIFVEERKRDVPIITCDLFFLALPDFIYSTFLLLEAGRFIYSLTVVTGGFSFPPGKHPVLFLSKDRVIPYCLKKSRELETCHGRLSHQFNFTGNNKKGQCPILETVACILKLLIFQPLLLEQNDTELYCQKCLQHTVARGLPRSQMQQECTSLLGQTQHYSFCFGQERECMSPDTLLQTCSLWENIAPHFMPSCPTPSFHI